jgi:hypothetical protein
MEVLPSKTIESARQHNNENGPELATEIAQLAKTKELNANGEFKKTSANE